MFRRITSFTAFLLLVISLFSGCSSKPSGYSYSPEGLYKVSSTGGCFSNDDIIYFIVTDRFHNGDKSNDKDTNVSDPLAYHGGDLKGITKRLDYIKSIGATAIWITPVVQNETGGYHGYWAYDFTKVDAHLGTMKDLKTLVKEAHKRDIKVLVDYVVNHTGPNSLLYTDGKHTAWFHPKAVINNFEDKGQCENGWLSSLPDLNQENPEARNYLINNALWWIESSGIDGMRLDTVKHVPKEFWNLFAYEIKKKYPDFYLLGEVWHSDPAFLDSYNAAGIDSITNFPLYYGIKDTFKPGGNTYTLVKAIHKQEALADPSLTGLFIDNHDNPRFVNGLGDNAQKYLTLSLAFLLTYPGIPIIYYGTETGMDGGKDPDNRRDMDWQNINSSDILNSYRKLVETRNSIPALRSKDFKLLEYSESYIAYSRGKGKDNAIVAINNSNTKNDIVINVIENTQEYCDIFSNKDYTVKNSQIILSLEPLSYAVLKSK